MNIFKIDSDKDSIWTGLIIPTISWAIAITLLVMGAVYFGDKYVSCPNLGESLNKEVKYNFWAGGCFVQLSNGNWIASDKYNGVTLESN